MTRQEAYSLLGTRLKGLLTNFDPDHLDASLDETIQETGWSFPVTGNFKEMWFMRRALRNALFLLLTESANKFQYKKIHLEHRFKHFKELIQMMDSQFAAALEANPVEFAGVESYQAFGHQLSSGLAYDRYGKDVAYTDENKVIIGPKYND